MLIFEYFRSIFCQLCFQRLHYNDRHPQLTDSHNHPMTNGATPHAITNRCPPSSAQNPVQIPLPDCPNHQFDNSIRISARDTQYDRSRDHAFEYNRSRDHIRHKSRDETLDPSHCNTNNVPPTHSVRHTAVKLERVEDDNGGDRIRQNNRQPYTERYQLTRSRDNRYIKNEHDGPTKKFVKSIFVIHVPC